MSNTNTMTIGLPGVGDVPLTVSDQGSGRPLLLLHGGGGVRGFTDFADRLSRDLDARVILPTHPGFDGTPQPGGLDTVAKLALLYISLLETLDLTDVIVIGTSFGGWTTAELATTASSRVAAYVLVDAIGAEVKDHPVLDFYSIPPEKIADYSFYEPEKFRMDPATLPPGARQAMADNMSSMNTYTGGLTADPTLLERLGSVGVPALVLWGEADGIADPGFAQAFAAAIPGGRFELLLRAGHLPQLETPENLAKVISQFISEVNTAA